MNSVIEVHELKKTYRIGWFRRRRLEALKGISLNVRAGEIFGLLGPNGAGKTTFIKILLGIAKRTSGSVALLGHRAGDRISRREIGYMPENLRIPRYHTAVTALNFYGQLSGLSPATIRRRSAEMLEVVGLKERARDNIAQYSKGMLQRLGLAQALLHKPRLLILDEPTDGLDPVGRAQVRSILHQFKQDGHTVFVNSHILQEVELICDRVAILDHGTERFVGTVSELTRQLMEQQPHDLAVNFELRGNAERVEPILSRHGVRDWQTTAVDHFHAVAKLDQQSKVDLLVDDLRREGVSILQMTRKGVTLEDAFLSLLSQEAKQP